MTDAPSLTGSSSADAPRVSQTRVVTSWTTSETKIASVRRALLAAGIAPEEIAIEQRVVAREVEDD